MKCKYCDTINDVDAVFCKKCGLSLLDDDVKKNKQNKKKTKQKNKVKTKVKTKTKVKKIKQKAKKNNNKEIQRKMSFGQKLLMFLMFLIIIVLLGVCGVAGYYYYQEQNIEVPDLSGLTYNDATIKLAESDLKIIKKTKEVTDSNLDNVVISQNKKVGVKVAKNSKITVTIGELSKYKLPDFKGENIDKVKNTLNHKNIKYKITFKEVTSGEASVVVSQTPSKNNIIKINQIVYLVVSKKIEDFIEKEEDIVDDKDLEKDTIIEDTDNEKEEINE